MENTLNNVIDYFRNEKDNYSGLFSVVSKDKNSLINKYITSINITLTMVLLLTTIFLSFYSSNLNFLSSFYNNINNNVVAISTMNPSNRSITLADYTLNLSDASEKIAQNFDINRFIPYIIILIGLFILMLIIFWFLGEWRYDKKLEETYSEIVNIRVILSCLYLIKCRWKDKIDDEKIKKQILNVHLPKDIYLKQLSQIIGTLEKNEKMH